MANVNSISSNSYSSGTSLYGNRNVLTGLASGMDTETMIQNSVTGYQTKISSLQQEQTKLEWKQDAYRDLIDQMYSISQKYTSYTSKTNLASNAFFTNATTTTTNGENADKISATGNPKSDIQINAVTQLATSARYAVDASALKLNTTADATGKAISWGSSKDIGQLNGTMTLKYGTQTIDITFDEKDNDIKTAEDLKAAIEKKLADINVKTTKDTVKASALFNVKVDGNKFTIETNHSNKADDGSAVYINSVSGNVGKLLGATRPASTDIEDKVKNNSFTVPNFGELVKNQSAAEYIAGKSVEVTLDGVTKTIKIGDLTDVTVDTSEFDTQIEELQNKADRSVDENMQLSGLLGKKQEKINSAMNEALQKDLQASINKAFGAGKITVGTDETTGGLHFGVAEGSLVKVASSAAGEMLGIGKSGVSNYFNTGNTLSNLLSTSELNKFRMAASGESGTFRSVATDDGVQYYDAEDNLVKEGEDGNWYRTDEKGEFLYDMQINGVSVGKFTKDTALESVMTAINSNAEAGVKVSYSNLTSQFVFTSTETGEGSKVSMDSGLAKRLFEARASTLSDIFGEGQHNIKLNTGGVSITLANMSGDTDIGQLLNSIKNHPDDMKISVTNEDGSERSFTAGQLKAYANGTSGVSVEDSLGYTKGQDAVVNATVNGKTLDLKRSSNTIDMDGMKVTLKDTFSAIDETTGKVKSGDAVTFTTSSDADTIVDTVKAFVDDVNKLMKSVYDAYATQPLKKSSSKNEGYLPLTDEDKADMSESAIQAYEDKAKTGLLFGDTDLSQLYSKLLNSVQSFGSDRIAMEAIGLKTTYSGGVTQIDLNENTLRSALETDPDKVRTVFTKTKEGGSASDGLMANLKSTLTAYGSTSIGTPGLLVSKAGTKLSSVSLLNNNLQKQIDNLNTQIESWQTKLSNKIDYYTKQFTQLEKLMSQMNNQSSMLADLMGY